MSIKYQTPLICFLLLSLCSLSQNTFVPDDNFEQALIDLGYDSGPLDDYVPTVNIIPVTDLDVNSKNISDLTGIEDFINLDVLNCEANFLNALDISQNTKLTQLFCDNNAISILDISTLTNLKILWCHANQLSNINISQNTQLISLVCGNNQLSNLDISNNLSLNTLSFENNSITSVDLVNNTALNQLLCYNNLLTDLNISNNVNLVNLDCNNNQLITLNTANNPVLGFLDVSNNSLTELDLSNNSQLTEINCSYNNLCRLNLKNGNNSGFARVDFSNNQNLNCVVVDDPAGNHSSWLPTSFTNYVSSQNDCSNFVRVDTLDDFIGVSYTLPLLVYGNYFTASGGNGNALFSGDMINTSQTIYIYNETACDSNESRFNVLITSESYYTPKYFTPNNDGTHDLWIVQDFANDIKDIIVFDRYGKLIKYLIPDIGWDGTFNGKPLESNDYWYVIRFYTGETVKGHFALKR